MRDIKTLTTFINGVKHVYCDASYKEVVEYVYWKAARPLTPKEGWPLAKEYLPRMSYPNFVSASCELTRGKGLVRIQHGTYVHKEVLDMLS